MMVRFPIMTWSAVLYVNGELQHVFIEVGIVEIRNSLFIFEDLCCIWCSIGIDWSSTKVGKYICD